MFRKRIITALLLTLASCSLARAQENGVLADAFRAGNAQAVLLARVNLYKPSIRPTVRINRQYSVAFALQSLDPVQTNVRYRVSFTDSSGAMIYSYAFDDALTLPMGEMTYVQNSFPVPEDMQGSYTGLIEVVNREGLPLASANIPNVTFVKQAEAPFTIGSCSLNKNAFDKMSSVKITCTVSGKTDMFSKLSYDLYRGNRASAYSKGMITINDKKVMFSFPAPMKPDNYHLYIQGYQMGTVIGKTASMNFVVNGTPGDLLSINADKQSYQIGDTAHVNVGINVFSSSGEPRAVNVIAAMENEDQTQACGPTAEEKIIHPGAVSLNMPITEDCNGYSLDVKLIDSRGVPVDEDILDAAPTKNSRFVEFLDFLLILATATIVFSAIIHKIAGTKLES